MCVADAPAKCRDVPDSIPACYRGRLGSLLAAGTRMAAGPIILEPKLDECCANDLCQHSERKIDARSHAAACDDIAVANHAAFIRHRARVRSFVPKWRSLGESNPSFRLKICPDRRDFKGYSCKSRYALGMQLQGLAVAVGTDSSSASRAA
jgi:hypothetical protein